MEKPKRLVLGLDVETGGLDPQEHSLLQVGAVVYDLKADKMVDVLDMSIKHSAYSITPEAMAVNKIDLLHHSAHGIGSVDAYHKFKGFVIKNFGEYTIPTPVGMNVGFDLDFLKAEWGRGDVEDLLGHRYINVTSLLLAKVYAGEIPKGTERSDRAFKYYDVEPVTPHEAVCDAMASLQLLSKLIAK